MLCWLLLLQGAVGLDQYETHLPAGLVWVHVMPGLPVLARDAVGGLRGRRGGQQAVGARAPRCAPTAPVRDLAPFEFPGN